MVAVSPGPRPGHVIVQTNRRQKELFDVERLELATGELTPIAQNPGNIQGWLANRRFAIRAARAQTPSGDSQLLVRDDEAATSRSFTEFANEDGGHPYAFTPDGGEIYVGSARGARPDRLGGDRLRHRRGAGHRLRRGGRPWRPGPERPDGDLLGAAYLRDRSVVHSFDPTFARDSSGFGRCTTAIR